MSSVEVEWGLWLEPTQPVRRLVDLACLAESLGAMACFVADEGTERDVYVALTAILGETNLIVGPAITNPFSRHPVATAAAVATLAELAPGRVWHGLGVGGSRVLDPLGMSPQRPYTALKEALDLNKKLLAGESVGAASLPWFNGDVPIAVAGRGPRVQRLAAQKSDCVILSAVAHSDLAAVAARIRHQGTAQVAWSAYLAYNKVERRRVLRHFTYMALDAPADVRANAGFDDETASKVRHLMLSGRMNEAAELLPDTMVDIYGLAGTPAQIGYSIANLRPHFDLFMVTLNQRASAESHIRQCAAIINIATDHLKHQTP